MYEQGRLDEGAGCYRQALSVQPDHADAAQQPRDGVVRTEAMGGGVAACFDPPWNSILTARTFAGTGPSLLLLHPATSPQGWPEYACGCATSTLTPECLFRTANGTVLPFPDEPSCCTRSKDWATRSSSSAMPLTSSSRADGGLFGPDSLLRLLATCPGIDQVASWNAGPPPFDVHASLLSLPGLLGTTLQTIPAAIPYLEASPEEVEHWRRQLHEVRALLVGVVWQGNPGYKNDRRRSVPLATFAPLGAGGRSIQLQASQMGAGAEQLAALVSRFALAGLRRPAVGRLGGDGRRAEEPRPARHRGRLAAAPLRGGGTGRAGLGGAAVPARLPLAPGSRHPLVSDSHALPARIGPGIMATRIRTDSEHASAKILLESRGGQAWPLSTWGRLLSTACWQKNGNRAVDRI